MTGARGVCLLALVAGVAAQYGAQGNSYDQELRRRQVEYAQQQAMRQQQAGYGNQQSQQAAYAQQQQQAAYQQQLRQQQAMKAQQQQQAQQRAYQEQLMQQQMREQAMRAQAQAGGSGQFQYGSSGGGSKPMTPKQKKELAKRQAAQKKAMEAKAKENKAAAAKRMKAWEQAQRKAHKGKGNMRAKRTSEKGGVVGFVFSIKGAALLGGMGYLYVAQRDVLMKLVQVPLMVAKLVLAKSWALLLKPVLRKIIQLKGSAGGAGAGLPGGSY